MTSAGGELPGMWEEADLSGGWADTDGMNARKQLYTALMRGGPHSPDRSEKASALLDAYAHELAEEIRAKADKVRAEDWGRSNRSKRPWLMGMEAARKVIDPEKQS